MRSWRMAAAAGMAVALSGCATVIKGSTQTVSVSSPPVRGARCVLFNSEGNWDLLTPGAVTVTRSRDDMSVVCTKRGFKDSTKLVSSHFNFVTMGNLVAGGTAGFIIDATDGADDSYPEEIEVPMEPAPRAPALAPIYPAGTPAS